MDVQPGASSLSPGTDLTSTSGGLASSQPSAPEYKTYLDDFEEYLAVRLAQPPLISPARTRTRDKVARLSRLQFFELSTDVYDEMVRRIERKLLYLPAHDEFHPKRNQARQKLSTLPHSRFEDLSSDVHFDILRRYPQLKKESLEAGPTAAYSDFAGPAIGYQDDSATSDSASNSNSNSQAQAQRQPEPGPPISASPFSDSDNEFSANAGPTGFMRLGDADHRDREEAEPFVEEKEEKEEDRRLEASEARVGQLEEELAALRLHAEEQSHTINALREELDGLRGAQETGWRF